MAAKKKLSEKNDQVDDCNFPDTIAYLTLVAAIIIVSFIRIRLLSFPLERDEGEYAYFGQLILQGIPPYKLAYNLKFPGTYYSYAMIMAVFGQTVQGIRLGLLFLNIGSLVFLFFLARKLFNGFVASCAVLSFGVLMVSPAIAGQAAHATHFVTFFMLAGLWFLLKALDNSRMVFYLLSGLLTGFAFLMKQSGVFFIFSSGLMIIFRYIMISPPLVSDSPQHHTSSPHPSILHPASRILHPASRILHPASRYLTIFIIGSFIPLLTVFILLYTSGVFSKFWFWTVNYPAVYASRYPLSQAFSAFSANFPIVYSSFTVLWIIVGLGIGTLYFHPAAKLNKLYIWLLLLASVCTVIPGFYFRNHYFVTVLPVTAILCGIFPDFLSRKIKGSFKQAWIMSLLIMIFIIITGLNERKDYYFNERPDDLCSRMLAENPFSEAIPVARYIRANSQPVDRVFVFGSEPEIYFYSGRRAASGYIYMYDLVFPHKYTQTMQDEMEKEVEANHPKFVVFVSSGFSWLAQKAEMEPLIKWMTSYLQNNHYSITGVADILFPAATQYAWDGDAQGYQRKSKNYLLVFRKSDQ